MSLGLPRCCIEIIVRIFWFTVTSYGKKREGSFFWLISHEPILPNARYLYFAIKSYKLSLIKVGTKESNLTKGDV